MRHSHSSSASSFDSQDIPVIQSREIAAEFDDKSDSDRSQSDCNSIHPVSASQHSFKSGSNSFEESGNESSNDSFDDTSGSSNSIEPGSPSDSYAFSSDNFKLGMDAKHNLRTTISTNRFENGNPILSPSRTIMSNSEFNESSADLSTSNLHMHASHAIGMDPDLRKNKSASDVSDRLARILSLSKGRRVDPDDVQLEQYTTRPADLTSTSPSLVSPSSSESAAAGVGSFSNSTSDSEQSITSEESDSNNWEDDGELHTLSARADLIRHYFVLLLAAALFLIWLHFIGIHQSVPASVSYSNYRYQSASPPWHVLLGSFAGVEIVEIMMRRTSLMRVPVDLAFYLLLVIVAIKLDAVNCAALRL